MNQFKRLTEKEKAKYIASITLYPMFMIFRFLGRGFKLFGTKKRQITASLLSVAMIFTMLPVMPQMAAEESSTEITTWEQLQEAINNGGSIKLMQNITCESPTNDNYLNVPSETTVTIDLNGYTIDRNLKTSISNGSVIINYGNLTITDTSTAKDGKVTGGNVDGIPLYGGGGVLNRGNFVMNGGSIECK